MSPTLASIRFAVEAADDVTVLINNAGILPSSAGILSHTDAEIRTNIETNFFCPLFLARAFAPTLTAKDEAAIIDIHSALRWFALGGIYSAAKAALWSATNSLRLELDPQGVHVGVHVGYVDTAMAAHTTDPKTDPADLVRIVFDALEAGEYEGPRRRGLRAAQGRSQRPDRGDVPATEDRERLTGNARSGGGRLRVCRRTLMDPAGTRNRSLAVPRKDLPVLHEGQGLLHFVGVHR